MCHIYINYLNKSQSLLTRLAQQASVALRATAFKRLIAVAVLAAWQRLAGAARGPRPAQPAAALSRGFAEPARVVAV